MSLRSWLSDMAFVLWVWRYVVQDKKAARRRRSK
jgi:hypothetical protein